jgi:hypothetical protein
MNFDEESVKKMNKLPKESVMGLASFMLLFILAMVGGGIYETQSRKTHGIVGARDKDALYIRGLKDTAEYYGIARTEKAGKKMSPLAFDNIKVGDTLEFFTNRDYPHRIDMVRSVNSEHVIRFSKACAAKHYSDSIRSRMLQNQKVK